MADDLPNDPIKDLHRSFQTALGAGFGCSRRGDGKARRDRFDKDLASGEFKKSGLHSVASTLMSNMQRLQLHASLPVACFNYGRFFQEEFSNVCAQHGIDPAVIRSNDNSPDEQVTLDAIQSQMIDWIFTENQSRSLTGLQTHYANVAGFAVSSLCYRTDQVEAFYCSIIIEAWSLFESLSEDLWEASINSHPTVLGALAGRPRSRPTGSDASDRQGEVSAARISFNDLQASGFDVKQRMGTLLKRCVSFRSLSTIREAYHRAFSKQSQSIDDILDDADLQYAAAVRNVLVHKGGIVDNEFNKQIAGVPNTVTLSPGDKLPVTGQLAERLCDGCRCDAAWLVNAAHAWIIGHPE